MNLDRCIEATPQTNLVSKSQLAKYGQFSGVGLIDSDLVEYVQVEFENCNCPRVTTLHSCRAPWDKVQRAHLLSSLCILGCGLCCRK